MEGSGNFTEAPTMQFNSTGPQLQQLCGAPGICEPTALTACPNTTLHNCDKCASSQSVLFVFFGTLLGLFIIAGNLLVITVGIHRARSHKATKVDACRNSLALADILTGIQIFAVALPNYAWTMNSTGVEVDQAQWALSNSPQAIAGASIFLFTFTSSIYHLLFFAVLRLYAIGFPLRYRSQPTRRVYFALVIVWLVSIAAASIPGWFPQYYFFEYYHFTFLFFPALNYNHLENAPAYVALVFFLVIPYGLMTIFMIATAGLVLKSSTLSKSNLVHGREKHKMIKKEFQTFKAVAIMQFGFTLTLLPLCVVVGLSYSQYFDCNTVGTPYMIAFYLIMSNSLVNVAVYSALDDKFQTAVRCMLASWKVTCCNRNRLDGKSTSARSRATLTTTIAR
ncbi:unnamed protein product [Clavelina lepadiformis]|uniref:G-protein coupled receptors family 1 profile domain-containing protein n=1 Tax=Clavelina lepadiformis TaxID=159417 RepID=A0ABP0F4A1_CLALP